MKPLRELAHRLLSSSSFPKHTCSHDHSDDRAWHDDRVKELRVPLMAGKTHYSYHHAAVIAQERASMELYARCPTWLPTPGLERFRAELETAGFILGLPERCRTAAHFPEGWEIRPRPMPLGSSHAALVSPQGNTLAVIFYRDSVAGDTFTTRLDPP